MFIMNGLTQEKKTNMKDKIILSIFSLITTIVPTLLCWWICGCPKIQSDTDVFLLVLIELTLYNHLKSEFERNEE